MKLFSPIILFMLAACPTAWAQKVPASTDPLAEARPFLKSDYADLAGLNLGPNDRMQDVVTRSRGGIVLQPKAVAPAAPAPILAALLPDNVIYCRLGSFRPASSWDDLASQLGKWTGQGMVLDLRSNGAPDDFDGAAHLAGLVTPAGTPLFQLCDAHGETECFFSAGPKAAAGFAPFTGPLVVLIDGRTRGAAEALAGVLHDRGALVLGHKTTGLEGAFTERRLSSGQVLRYLTSEVIGPDGNSLWRQPVVPDIDVAADDKKEQAALALIGQEHIADVIGESAERRHMNEASLVSGQDPEIDTSLAAQKAPGLAPPGLAGQDIVLVDALDSLKAIRFSQHADASPDAGAVTPAAR